MQTATMQSRTSRIIEEFLLFDATDEDEADPIEQFDDEVLSSAGGPYHWVPAEM